MIDVEVKGRLGQYIKAVLRNVIEGEAVVLYSQRDEQERVALSRVRLPPTPSREVQAGQVAEVLFSVDDSSSSQAGDSGGPLSTRWGDKVTPTSDKQSAPINGQDDHLDVPAWWPCRVHKIRDDVAVVKLQVSPPSNATPEDVSLCLQLSNVTDIVERNVLRQPSNDLPSITADMIHRHTIEIPKELADFASDTSVHVEFARHCGGPMSMFYDADSSSLVVLSTDLDTIQNVALLKETHLKMLRQKWAITRSLRQTMRTLEASRGPDGAHTNMGSSRSSGDWETDPSMFYERFYVPQRLMGLAIGKQGANIQAARAIPGVSIRLCEANDISRRNGDVAVDNVGDCGDAALFIVEAKTQEAAKKARAKLEFTELYLGVPKRYVGRLIGKKTANIVSIIRKSGVFHIHFDDHIKGPSDDEETPNIEGLNLNYSGPNASRNIKRTFLRAGGSQATSHPHEDEEYGGFILVGTRESIDRARLLINFQMDYIYDLEKMEAEKTELMRSLSHAGPEVGSNYPPRNYADGPNPGRWSERGGVGPGRGGRGGRGAPRGQPYHPPLLGPYPGGGLDNAPVTNHIPDREGSGPYGGVRRLPRDPRNIRQYNGDTRPRRQALRGGRGMRRGSTAARNSGGEWSDQTGSNGDVADRRRGSEDSDALGSNLSHEVESDEREVDGRSSRGGRSGNNGTKRSSECDTSGAETNEGNFPGGDSMGENSAHSNGTARLRGSSHRGRVRPDHTDSPRTGRSRNQQQPPQQQQRTSNGESTSGSSESSLPAASNSGNSSNKVSTGPVAQHQSAQQV